jgi:hypothetical protein
MPPKRPHSSVSKASTRPRKRQVKGKNPTKAADASGSAASLRTLDIPQASFQGLPAELRLEIYDHLCDSTIIHVHRKRKKFTWTPCLSPSDVSPLLCKNPKWSGMCKEKDRCTHKEDAPPEPLGFAALAASNKFIRNETQDFILRKAVVSIHPRDLRPWLDHVGKTNPRHINNLRRITLAGPNTSKNFSNIEFELIHDRLPKLEGIGVQCQDSVWRWTGFYDNQLDKHLRPDTWKEWNITEFVKRFDSYISVACEAIIWHREDLTYAKGTCGYQRAIRMIRNGAPAGNGSGSGWADEDVEFGDIKQEGERHGCVMYKANERWSQWWRGEDTRQFPGHS